jgi:potassium inwardly-rectifying channel subfamily J
MSDECIEAIVLLVVQSIIGVIIESLTVGVFIVKLSSMNLQTFLNAHALIKCFYKGSKKRAQTVVFSKFAVICKKENGFLALAFRVSDVGKV